MCAGYVAAHCRLCAVVQSYPIEISLLNLFSKNKSNLKIKIPLVMAKKYYWLLLLLGGGSHAFAQSLNPKDSVLANNVFK